MTGSSWIPRLPDGWRMTSIRRMGKIFAGGTPDRKNDTFWSNGDIPWLNSGAVNQGVITTPSTYITKEATLAGATRWVEPGSVVVALAGQGKTKGMSARTEIKTTFNQSLAAIQPTSGLDYRYLHYWLQSNYKNIRNLAGGDLRDGLNLDHIGSIELPLPPITTQRHIVTFLDHETAEIDTLIENFAEVATLTKSRWDANRDRLISRGTSKECPSETRPGAWLPQVRSDWPETSIKNIFHIQLGKMLDEKRFPKDAKLLPYIRAANIEDGNISLDDLNKMPFTPEEQSKFSLKAGDILVVEGGSVGLNYVLTENFNGIYFQKTVHRMRLTKDLSPHYYSEVLNAYRERGIFEILGNKSTIHHLTADKLGDLKVPLPPPQEQELVAQRLQEERSGVRALTIELERAVSLARERRAALITAAVTGQIDVTAKAKPVAEQLEDDIAQGLHREN